MGVLRARVGGAWEDVAVVGPPSGPLVYANLAAAKAGTPSPSDGVQAWLVDESSLLVGKGGTWRWLNKTYDAVNGNTTYLTWAALCDAANSQSNLLINGRHLTLMMDTNVVTPTTSSSAQIGTLATAFRTSTTRIDYALSTGHGSGAGSGRCFINNTGSIMSYWGAGDNPTAVTGFFAVINWTVPDLIPA